MADEIVHSPDANASGEALVDLYDRHDHRLLYVLGKPLGIRRAPMSCLSVAVPQAPPAALLIRLLARSMAHALAEH